VKDEDNDKLIKLNEEGLNDAGEFPMPNWDAS